MNMYWTVILIPAAGALALLPARRNAAIAPVLLFCAVAHAAATAWILISRYTPEAHSWIGPDGPGKLFLAITSGLFLATAGYTSGFLKTDRETAPKRNDSLFACCFLLFLSAMSLACVTAHLGIYWVAIETTTLVSAPLITLHHNPRSLEAVWKYLLICSVGIALALLGLFFLATAAGDAASDMTMGNLLASAPSMDPVWLKAAFILLLVGFGTKMGLAPMHTWLPDAHSESPSMVSALLSGALLNCAFLGILRGHAICSAAGIGDLSGELMVLFGLLSMLTAGIFMIRQTDYKRMLAYSSIEHMGILALGAGTGGIAAAGAMLHAITHSAGKGMLFLAAGNLATAYGTKSISRVRGAIGVIPVTGVLWFAGILAIAGTPPFGIFISEFIILKGLLSDSGVMATVLYLLALALVFTAMTRLVIPMVFGGVQGPPAREHLWSTAGPLALAVVLLAAGLFVPAGLWKILQGIAAGFGGPHPCP